MMHNETVELLTDDLSGGDESDVFEYRIKDGNYPYF